MAWYTWIVGGDDCLELIVSNVDVRVADSTELDVKLHFIITQLVALDPVC